MTVRDESQKYITRFYGKCICKFRLLDEGQIYMVNTLGNILMLKSPLVYSHLHTNLMSFLPTRN